MKFAIRFEVFEKIYWVFKNRLDKEDTAEETFFFFNKIVDGETINEQKEIKWPWIDNLWEKWIKESNQNFVEMLKM